MNPPIIAILFLYYKKQSIPLNQISNDIEKLKRIILKLGGILYIDSTLKSILKSTYLFPFIQRNSFK